MKSTEPGIVGFYRLESARIKFEEGQPIEEICLENDTTPEELMQWIDGSDEEDEDED
jgi:hypothetical protein